MASLCSRGVQNFVALVLWLSIGVVVVVVDDDDDDDDDDDGDDVFLFCLVGIVQCSR